MKKVTTAIMMFLGICAYAVQVDLPEERLTLPDLQGDYLVCIWDDFSGAWVNDVHPTYDHSGSLNFQVPSTGKWYWIGLWNKNSKEYVFGKWVGHFPTN